MLWLLTERFGPAPAGDWAPYIAALPGEVSGTALSWPRSPGGHLTDAREGRRFLAGVPQLYCMMYRRLHQTPAAERPFPIEAFTLRRWLCAGSVMSSRQTPVKGALCLVPLWDLLDHDESLPSPTSELSDDALVCRAGVSSGAARPSESSGAARPSEVAAAPHAHRHRTPIRRSFSVSRIGTFGSCVPSRSDLCRAVFAGHRPSRPHQCLAIEVPNGLERAVSQLLCSLGQGTSMTFGRLFWVSWTSTRGASSAGAPATASTRLSLCPPWTAPWPIGRHPLCITPTEAAST
ncbi:MAG: hypothetical protein ACI9MR_003987, partial [Myxococcota bacterium]